jgi:hypothetical protein
MNGRGHWTMIGGKYLAAVFCQPKLCSEETLRRSCTQADDQLRSNGGNLRFQPGTAGCYFKRVWLLVQPNLSARFPLEMLNGIGNVHLTPIDTRGLEALIKQLAGGSNKRLSLLVFAISGLFPHQENRGVGAAFPKDGLRGFPIKVASTTLPDRLPKAAEVMVGREIFQG